MKLYAPNEKYLDYLRKVERKVLETSAPHYTNAKLLVGIVFEIDSINYYVPLSSIKDHQVNREKTSLAGIFKKTCFPIRNKEQKIIATLRFDYMLPFPLNQLSEINFNGLEENYKNLVLEEYNYCKKSKSTICLMAEKIYSSSKKPTHILNQHCLNFSLLENQYIQWVHNEKKEE